MAYYDDADYNANLGYEPEDAGSVTSYVTGTGFPGGSVDSRTKKNRKLMEDMKSADKGYHCIKTKKSKIEFYSTNYTPGTRIRDAMTGMRYKHLVGSRDEYLFFKVAFCTGQCGQETQIIFYDSPEDYEKNQKCTLPDSTKSTWRERYNEELLIRKYEADRRTFGDMVVVH